MYTYVCLGRLPQSVAELLTGRVREMVDSGAFSLRRYPECDSAQVIRYGLAAMLINLKQGEADTGTKSKLAALSAVRKVGNR